VLSVKGYQLLVKHFPKIHEMDFFAYACNKIAFRASCRKTICEMVRLLILEIADGKQTVIRYFVEFYVGLQHIKKSMKKGLLFLFVFILTGTQLWAQLPPETEPVKPTKVIKKPKRQDQIMLDLHGSQILREQGQQVLNKWYSYGVPFQLMWDQPIKKSPVALAAGIGISNDNYFIDRKVNRDADNNTYLTAFNDPFKRYKFSTTHIEIPVELRFRIQPERRNTFKINLGFKVGYLLGAKTKYVGAGYNYGVYTDKVKIKEYNIPGINSLKYGVYVRLAYSRYGITAGYQLSEVFRNGKGPAGWNPITIGFTVAPF
jgi:hypothetical protein